MKKNLHYTLAACAIAAASSLAGCGVSEPSEKEMIDATVAFYEGNAFFGSPDKFREEAKKLGCEKVGDKSYKCMIGQRNGKAGSMSPTFMKTDNGWVMTMPGTGG